MKKTLLLMGILVSFLSCQKDSDKACPHLATTESLTSPVGDPIKTCDEPVTINLYTVTYQRNEYGTIIDSVFDTSLKAVVYHYNKTVFIKFSYEVLGGRLNVYTQDGTQRIHYSNYIYDYYHPGGEQMFLFHLDGKTGPNGYVRISYDETPWGPDKYSSRDGGIIGNPKNYILYRVTRCCDLTE